MYIVVFCALNHSYLLFLNIIIIIIMFMFIIATNKRKKKKKGVGKIVTNFIIFSLYDVTLYFFKKIQKY